MYGFPDTGEDDTRRVVKPAAADDSDLAVEAWLALHHFIYVRWRFDPAYDSTAFVCPPAWDLAPREYLGLLHQAFSGGWRRVLPRLATGGAIASGAAMTTGAVLAMGDVVSAAQFDQVMPVGLGALVASMGAAMVANWNGRPPSRQERDTARTVLADLDPTKVVEFEHDNPEAWSTGQGFFENPSTTAEQRGVILAEFYRMATGAPVDIPVQESPTGGSPVSDASGGPADRWARAVRDHDAVTDAWGAVITDPLNALTHAALFDVTQHRTAAFIEAYGAVQDFRSIYGTTWAPLSDPVWAVTPATDLLTRYVGLVRRATAAWDEARRWSERVGWDWLPEAEAAAARKAAGLLALAADESATFHERAAAALKAADLLKSVSTVMLPAETYAALDGQTAPALAPRS